MGLVLWRKVFLPAVMPCTHIIMPLISHGCGATALRPCILGAQTPVWDAYRDPKGFLCSSEPSTLTCKGNSSDEQHCEHSCHRELEGNALPVAGTYGRRDLQCIAGSTTHPRCEQETPKWFFFFPKQCLSED